MKPILAVLFDLDGTLANTIGDLHCAVNHALAQAHLPQRTKAETLAAVGNGIRRLIDLSLPAGTPAETAYKNILSNIRKYISDPQYSGNTQNLYGFVQLTSGSTSKEQEIICFYGETPKLLEKGYIEVYKKDAIREADNT